MEPPQIDSPEDAKIVKLAKAARARTGAREGAAVRDADGRTYAAATVDLPSLQLSALSVAVAMAVSSGARGLEAAALATPDGAGDAASDWASDEAGVSAVRDLGGERVPVICADETGTVQQIRTT